MKNKILLFLLFVSTTAVAQRDNEFQIRLGLGGAAYATQTNLNYDVNTFIGTFHLNHSEKDNAATTHIPIELRYEINPRLNVGLDMKFGSYLYSDSTDHVNKSNSFGSFGIAGEFSALNKENTRVYIGLCLNSTSLVMEEKMTVNNVHTNTTATWKGGGIKVNVGVIQYFGSSPIGVNFNLGYDSHNFDLKKWDYPTGTSLVTLGSYKGTLETKGVDIALGLVFRIKKK